MCTVTAEQSPQPFLYAVLLLWGWLLVLFETCPFCVAVTILILYVDQGGFNLRDLPASASQVMELKEHSTIFSPLYTVFKEAIKYIE